MKVGIGANSINMLDQANVRKEFANNKVVAKVLI